MENINSGAVVTDLHLGPSPSQPVFLTQIVGLAKLIT